ncbi:MAG: hypothetical protein ABL866_08250 [Devosia sp.]
MNTISPAINSAPAKPAMPDRNRMALLVLIGVYPIVTGLLYLIGPLTTGWDVWQRTLVLAPMMVVLMIYGLIPFIQTRLRGFLMGRR